MLEDELLIRSLPGIKYRPYPGACAKFLLDVALKTGVDDSLVTTGVRVMVYHSRSSSKSSGVADNGSFDIMVVVVV